MTVLPPQPPADNLEELVRGHLDRALEGQRGRAAAAFRARVQTTSVRTEPAGFSFERAAAMRQVKLWAGAASALAACLALVVTLQFTLNGKSSGERAQPFSQSSREGSLAGGDGGGLNVTDVGAPQMDQVELSRNVDGGTALLREEGQEMPVRVVRQQTLRHTQWFDPREKATYSVTEPVEKVGYVRIQPY